MPLKEPIPSRYQRSYVADASIHRNLPLSSVRAAAASKCLLLAKCGLLAKRVGGLPTACIVTRVRCWRCAGPEGWRGLSAYDDGAAARGQTNEMTPGWSATATPHPTSGAAAGAHSPKRTGSQLHTAANRATIVSAVPVAIAASSAR